MEYIMMWIIDSTEWSYSTSIAVNASAFWYYFNEICVDKLENAED